MNSMLATTDINALAHQLCSLRQNGSKVLTGQLVSVPVALEDAIDVQRQLSTLEGADLSAWKVAKSPSGDSVAAPLHPYLDNPPRAVLTWRKGMKIEVEIAVELCRDLPLRTDRTYERADIEAAISNAYLGAELVWSGISEGGEISFLAFLADRLGNSGYVKGPSLSLATLRPGSSLPLTISFDENVVFDATAQHPTKDVLTWLRDYANDLSRPDASLRAGSIITTGSFCGAIEIAGSCDVNIKVAGDVSLHLALS
ncbi:MULTISPECIES: hypothetical protein [Agrobacterium]|uniref:2-keto-4-pentenoate hydratase n=1 Tax=Agrobacterium tumefaciens TaxID=358 RepID=A0AAE6BH84_AGRTU|nr:MULTISPECIES: hypothetical protein [Agrobacterium]QCL77047.1 2-keto-4-pentenoate hydratase [Agrobacterium tumefaciens]QCL82554.1 2-keto-4-pentenoate hydratase [Agrobacterium tumefaciens]CUX71089.1 conserved hypothetical protein [Agrobacterium sp. NCPPB 925]